MLMAEKDIRFLSVAFIPLDANKEHFMKRFDNEKY